MKITRNGIEYIAGLARLALRDEELEALTSEMDNILAYVEKLNELDTGDILPTAYAVPVENRFREDRVQPSLDIEKVLQNAPSSENGYFRVPKIIE